MKRHHRLSLILMTGMGVLWIVQPDDAPEAAAREASPAVRPLVVRTASAPAPAHSLPSGPDQEPARADHELAPGDLHADLAGLPEDASYVPGQLLVTATDADVLRALARDHGAQVALSRSGDAGVIRAAPGTDMDALQEAIRNTAGVTSAQPNGIVRGAHYHSSEPPPSYRSLQWHLDVAEIDRPSGVSARVAVLDTGLAYRTGMVYSSAFGWIAAVKTPSLDRVSLYDPWDYLRNNPYPDDEHWHGTHIASTIASSGAVDGVAPGVTVMPYRVLDHNNVGTEFSLVDALKWAAIMDADVVNMSLSFGPDYVPSSALLDRLDELDAAGIVMVGAAGNTGAIGSTWPAASRHVISVGASCGADDLLVPAPYSNHGGDVDILAPGGCNDRDADLDGYPDGILAESFETHEPDRPGLYFVQGTSQAAAVVSGMAARLRQQGVPASMVREVLQVGGDLLDEQADAGLSQRSANLAGAQATGGPSLAPLPAHQVAMLPWVEQVGNSGLRPHANLLVLDDQGQPVDGVFVQGHFRGTTDKAFRCRTTAGVCSVQGQVVQNETAAAWTVTVAQTGTATRGTPPTGVLLLNGALDDAYASLDTALGTVPPVGFALAAGTFPGSVASYSFPMVGSGLSTSPFGVIITEPFLDDIGATLDVGIEGSGLSTSPFGIVGIDLPGLQSPSLVTVEGSGLSTSPFGVVIDSTELPPACIGTATCDVSVLDPDGGVVGELSGASAAAVAMSETSQVLGLAGSTALVDGAATTVELAGQADQSVLFLAE